MSSSATNGIATSWRTPRLRLWSRPCAGEGHKGPLRRRRRGRTAPTPRLRRRLPPASPELLEGLAPPALGPGVALPWPCLWLSHGASCGARNRGRRTIARPQPKPPVRQAWSPRRVKASGAGGPAKPRSRALSAEICFRNGLPISASGGFRRPPALSRQEPL